MMLEGLAHWAVVVWVAPDGRQLHLAGGPDEMREGVGLSQGVDGIGGLDPSMQYQQASRQVGETVTSWTFSHGEVDLPLMIFGESGGEVQAIREMVKSMFARDRHGWLCVYSVLTGWRWLRCRMLSMKPGLSVSPYPLRRAAVDVVLVAEDPRSEAVPYSSQWRNWGNQQHGEIWLSGGPEWVSWPTFVVQGPGRVELSLNGSTIRLPSLEVGERCLWQSDPTLSVLRSVAADGTSRNRWMDVDGYLSEPIPAGEMTRVGIRVLSGGSQDTAVLAQARVYQEGLL